MDWIQILIIAAIVIFIFLRFKPIKGLNHISSTQLKELMKHEQLKLVDVREPHEFMNGHIKGAVNIPLGTISKVVEKQLSKEDKIILICLSGARSRAAAGKLNKLGYSNLYNLTGGMSSWRN